MFGIPWTADCSCKCLSVELIQYVVLLPHFQNASISVEPPSKYKYTVFNKQLAREINCYAKNFCPDIQLLSWDYHTYFDNNMNHNVETQNKVMQVCPLTEIWLQTGLKNKTYSWKKDMTKWPEQTQYQCQIIKNMKKLKAHMHIFIVFLSSWSFRFCVPYWSK